MDENALATRRQSAQTPLTQLGAHPSLEKSEIKRVRRNSFCEHVPYDKDLEAIVRSHPSHQFLANPASQNTYLYQVELVANLSQRYFARPISELAILDWGCGKGHVTFLLKKRGACVTSCDYFGGNSSDDDSSFGQDVPIIKSAGITVDRLDDPVKLSYPDGSFDVVLSFGVLEHVQSDTESLRELHRVLRPGGMFFCFNLPYFLSWTQRISHFMGDFYHDRLYKKRGVKELLDNTGFGLLDIWHRQLFPKNSVHYPFYQTAEALDQTLVRFTPLKYLATNIEFVAVTR